MLTKTETSFHLICGFMAIGKLLCNAVREVRELDERPGLASPPMKTSPGIHTSSLGPSER